MVSLSFEYNRAVVNGALFCSLLGGLTGGAEPFFKCAIECCVHSIIHYAQFMILNFEEIYFYRIFYFSYDFKVFRLNFIKF